MNPLRSTPHYHCVGIGVGPSNLSMASLLYKHKEIKSAFFDRKPEFSWYDEMQFTGADLQVFWIKDLVSLADPTNPFSFLSYLHTNGRIYHFFNARFLSVARAEFRNYMKWACDRNENIHFGEEVIRVDFDGNFVVETTKRRVTAENIAVGIGAGPVVPSFACDQLCESKFHVSEFGSKAKAAGGKDVVVIGGGQSGAEAVLDLISRPRGELPRRVIWITRRENFAPLDDSPFTNDYFMPCHSDYFFEQERAFRLAFIERNILSSDGISEDTLRQIYRRLYGLRFIENSDLAVELMPGRRVHQAGRAWDQWKLVSCHGASGNQEIVYGDIVIWATGFRPVRLDFLASLEHRFERDGEEIKIDDDFAVCWDGPPQRCIFLFNATRGQRGLPDPNLSLTAWRSQRAIDRIRGVSNLRMQHIPSFVSWSSTASLAATLDRRIV